jgi:hypothetical protein
MARAEGAPGEDVASYMAGVARRLEERMGVRGISTASPAAFLDSLDERGVLPVETFPEPSDERVDREEALGDGPVVLGEGVGPDDVEL